MNYVKYSPFPNSDPGAGLFTTDAGVTIPAYLPDEAAKLTGDGSGALAINNYFDDQANAASNLGQGSMANPPGNMPPSKPDVGPNFSPDIKAPNATPAPNMSEAPNMSVSPPEPTAPVKPKLTTEEALKRAMGVEGGESGKGVNPTTGAFGSIQLIPGQSGARVASALGIDEPTLKKMSPEEFNKEAVPAYFKSIGHPLDTIDPRDVYMGIAAPGFIGKSDDTPIVENGKPWDRNSPAWKSNAGTWGKIASANGHDVITAGDLRQYGGVKDEGPATPKTPLSAQGQATAELANRLGAPVTSGGQTQTNVNLGIPLTDEDRAEFSRRQSNLETTHDLTAGAIQNTLDEAKVQQKARAEDLQRQGDAIDGREKAGQALYDQRQADIQVALKDINDDKAPKPFGGNVFAGILAVIGQALGAYGASITKTRNFAADMVNSMLDRENKQWEQEQMKKRFKVSTLEKLSDSAKSELSMARNDREQTQRLMYQNTLDQLRTKQWSVEQQKALDASSDNNQQHLDDLKLESERQSRQHVTLSMVGGSSRPATVEEQNKRAEQEVKSGKTPEEVAQARGLLGEESKIPVDQKERAAYEAGNDNRAGRTQIDQSERSILNLAKPLGLKYDDKTGQFVDADGKDHIRRKWVGGETQSPGPSFNPQEWGLWDDEDKKVYTALKGAAVDTAKSIYGTRASDKEFDRIVEQFGGLSKNDTINSLNNKLKEIREKRKDLDAAYPGAASDFETRRKAAGANGPIDFTPLDQ